MAKPILSHQDSLQKDSLDRLRDLWIGLDSILGLIRTSEEHQNLNDLNPREVFAPFVRELGKLVEDLERRPQ